MHAFCWSYILFFHNNEQAVQKLFHEFLNPKSAKQSTNHLFFGGKSRGMRHYRRTAGKKTFLLAFWIIICAASVKAVDSSENVMTAQSQERGSITHHSSHWFRGSTSSRRGSKCCSVSSTFLVDSGYTSLLECTIIKLLTFPLLPRCYYDACHSFT